MIPDNNTAFPLANYDRLCYLKNIITNPKIEVGDYTYYDDCVSVQNFEKNVKYHFPFTGDKLIIGRFCMIASGVTFIMNGANHLTDAVSSYPFAIFGGEWQDAMDGKQYPNKGNTIVGNDVWIGYDAVIMPGVKIGDGAIIAANATIVKDVKPYTIAGGNPAKPIRQRFSDKQVDALLKIKWWDWPVEKITRHVKLLTGNDIDALIELSE